MNDLIRSSILILDPDDLSATAIAAMLQTAGHQAWAASTVADAVMVTLERPFDLILCDEQIDADQGATAIGRLRQIPQAADAAVMYLSTHQGPDIIHRGRDGSAAYHLRKPIEPQVLLNLVDQALWQLPLINQHVQVRHPHFIDRTTSLSAETSIAGA